MELTVFLHGIGLRCWNYSVSDLLTGYRQFQSHMKHYNSSGNIDTTGYTKLYYRLFSVYRGTPVGTWAFTDGL